MKDFFISYNKADRAWALWIAWELEAAGYTTVVQAWDFRPGSNFVLEMHKASSETDRTMPVLSPDYLAAEYTQQEWAAALALDPRGEGRRLVPVRVRECTPGGLLRPVVYIELVGLDESDSRNTLIEGVRRERIKPSTQPSFPGSKPAFPGPSRDLSMSSAAVQPVSNQRMFPWRNLLVVFGTLSLAVAALFAWKYLQKPEDVSDPKPRAGYVAVPSGEFLMGCAPAEPPCYEDETQHPVRLSKFYLKQTEVTLGEFRQYAHDVGAPLMPKDYAAELPITNVTWEQAEAYCTWAGGRLPTEAEWEYAARGKAKGRFYGRLGDIAWYQGNTPISAPQKVGQKLSNAFGLYDMLGNVAEWVNDWYNPDYYKASSPTNPKGPESGTERTIRGGSFLDGPDSLRVSRRDRKPPDAAASHVGFRCAQDR